jgi:hypothetical protein
MKMTRPMINSGDTAPLLRWLWLGSVLLLAALFLGPATGLVSALHHLHHNHGSAPLSTTHECDLCQTLHAPIDLSLNVSEVVGPDSIGFVIDRPTVPTGWVFVCPTAPRGPPYS